MSAIAVMKHAQLLDWHALLVGLERGWCADSDLVEYAQQVLPVSSGDLRKNLLDLTGGDHHSRNDLITLGLDYLFLSGDPMSSQRKLGALEKWRFAHLSELLKSDASRPEKIARLEELYAEFGFPDDMVDCIMDQAGVSDRLGAAKQVTRMLIMRCRTPKPEGLVKPLI